MNNKNFITELSQSQGYTQDDTVKLIHTVLDSMNECFMEGDSVLVPGFGCFEVKKRLERIMVNPGTKQRMLVPPKLVLGFKPVNSIKDKIKTTSAE